MKTRNQKKLKLQEQKISRLIENSKNQSRITDSDEQEDYYLPTDSQQDLYYVQDSYQTEKKVTVISAKRNQIKKTRPQNTVTSNVIRTFKKCIKKVLGKNDKTYRKSINFIEAFEIKSQLWGFEAILIYLIFLRDQLKEVSFQNFKSILNKVQTNFISLRNRSLFEITRLRIDIYNSYLKLYQAEETSFSLILNINDERARFYQALIKRKRCQMIEIIEKLKEICQNIAEEKGNKNKEMNEVAEQKEEVKIQKSV